MPRSLRARLVVGALLWSVALAWVVHLVSLALILHFRPPMSVVHYTLIGIVAVGLCAAALVQVGSGLSPLRRLRERLAAVRAGATRRIEGTYPSEVQPLVDDLNTLLDDRERRVARAQSKAGDLAHGLKTPLALLAQEAARLRATGQRDAAATLDEQIARMRASVDYHLAQARAAVSGATAEARCDVRESVDGLTRTMAKLYAERSLAFEVSVAPDLIVRVQRPDLDEMLGNLLDNACKAARTRVVVSARVESGAVEIAVDDDGAGLAPELSAAVLHRGVRADEAAPGSGLGLAIVRDLAELYGGSIALERSPLGGVSARLRLPG